MQKPNEKTVRRRVVLKCKKCGRSYYPYLNQAPLPLGCTSEQCKDEPKQSFDPWEQGNFLSSIEALHLKLLEPPKSYKAELDEAVRLAEKVKSPFEIEVASEEV
jgi:hypothetical protein